MNIFTGRILLLGERSTGNTYEFWVFLNLCPRKNCSHPEGEPYHRHELRCLLFFHCLSHWFHPLLPARAPWTKTCEEIHAKGWNGFYQWIVIVLAIIAGWPVEQCETYAKMWETKIENGKCESLKDVDDGLLMYVLHGEKGEELEATVGEFATLRVHVSFSWALPSPLISHLSCSFISLGEYQNE